MLQPLASETNMGTLVVNLQRISMQLPLTLAKSGARPNYLVHHEMLILYDFC